LKIQPARTASGGKEASSLAAASAVAGANFIARTAVGDIASGDAEPVEHSRQVESRQVKQISAGTAVVVAANFIARTTVGDKVARTAVGIEAVCNTVARIAVGETTTIQTEVPERIQTSKREPRGSTEINTTARIAVSHRDIARVAVRYGIARIAQHRSGKQASQASA